MKHRKGLQSINIRHEQAVNMIIVHVKHESKTEKKNARFKPLGKVNRIISLI